MAGRIFGSRVYGSRVYGRVFGGLSGTAAPEILGWLPCFASTPPRIKLRLTEQPVQPGWIPLAAQSALRNGVQQYSYLPPARAKLAYPRLEWQGSQGWINTGAALYTAAVSGWRTPHGVQGLPLKSTRGVKETTFDQGWITRATPGAPIPDVAFIAGINPEKGGYPVSARGRYPYLRYEYTPQFGWNWYPNVLPVIIAGVAAMQAQRGQEYRLRARPTHPYIQRWSANEGWIPKSVDTTLSATWAAVAGQTQQEYTLRGRARGAYLPGWMPQAGWLYAAAQLIVRDTYPAVATQSLQEYPLASRTKLRLSSVGWSAQEGWVYHPAFVDLNPIIAAIQNTWTVLYSREGTQVLLMYWPVTPQVPEAEEPEPSNVIVFIGSSFTREG